MPKLLFCETFVFVMEQFFSSPKKVKIWILSFSKQFLAYFIKKWGSNLHIRQIVKWVSWFKSSLLLRITIKNTNEYKFLIKTKESIFNRKVYATDGEEGTKCGLAWKLETVSILIKKKHKHLSKMLDRVSKKVWSASAKWKYS